MNEGVRCITEFCKGREWEWTAKIAYHRGPNYFLPVMGFNFKTRMLDVWYTSFLQKPTNIL